MPRRPRNLSCSLDPSAAAEPSEILIALAEARGQRPAAIVDRLRNLDAQTILKDLAEYERMRPTWPAVRSMFEAVSTYDEIPDWERAMPCFALRTILSTRVHVYARDVMDEAAVFFLGVLTFQDENPSPSLRLPFCASSSDEGALLYTDRTLGRIASTGSYRKRHRREILFPIYAVELVQDGRPNLASAPD